MFPRARNVSQELIVILANEYTPVKRKRMLSGFIFWTCLPRDAMLARH